MALASPEQYRPDESIVMTNFRDVQEIYALAKYVTGKTGVALLREILL